MALQAETDLLGRLAIHKVIHSDIHRCIHEPYDGRSTVGTAAEPPWTALQLLRGLPATPWAETWRAGPTLLNESWGGSRRGCRPIVVGQ